MEDKLVYEIFKDCDLTANSKVIKEIKEIHCKKPLTLSIKIDHLFQRPEIISSSPFPSLIKSQLRIFNDTKEGKVILDLQLKNNTTYKKVEIDPLDIFNLSWSLTSYSENEFKIFNEA